MSPDRVAVNKGSEQQPSHSAIDQGNPASFKLKYLVLDDINIDLISVIVAAVSLVSVFASYISSSKAFLVAAAIILPLRTFFPHPINPDGLVLITGGSSGIGAELAYVFANRGHDLVLVGRNEEQLETVRRNIEQKYKQNVCTIASDLSLPGAAKQLYENVISKGFNVSVLVNNAGLGAAGETLEQPIEIAERMTTLNCITLVQLTQLFGRDMAQRGKGWILQNSSVGGWMASPHHNIYHATKHFVRAFSESLSLELRAYPGVVNTQIMPGPTHTQWPTRAGAEETVMFGAPGSTNDPMQVALAAYEGLRKRKRMVFSSWGDAVMALFMQVAPRSVHLTMAALANSPTRGWSRMSEPEKDQGRRGEKLEGK